MKEKQYKGQTITNDGFRWIVNLLGYPNRFKTLGAAKDFIDRCEARGELSR